MSPKGAYPERYLGLSGLETARAGVVVSFRNSAGAGWVCHRTGPSTVAVRAACDDALSLDATFRVVCISTPASIYGDLRGRPIFRGGAAERPEHQLLARAGRRHMLHPDLIGRFSDVRRA